MANSMMYYLGASALLTSLLVYYKMSKKGTEKKKKKDKIFVGKVKELNLFPLKSARGISIDHADLEKTGLKIGLLGDRGLAVMTPKGHAITAMREPTVTTIITHFKDDKVDLEVGSMDPITIDLKQVEKAGKLATAKFMGTTAEVYDCGEEAADWISDFLVKPGHRIVYCGENLARRNSRESVKKNARLLHIEFTETFLKTIPFAEVMMSNGMPLSLTSDATIEDVDKRLPKPIGNARLRTNIVVGGVQSPYDEDSWDDIYIGDKVHVQFGRHMGRCSIVDTDPETGLKERGPTAPVKCMKDWRSLYQTERAKYVFLAISATIVQEGHIKVGDDVYVTRTELSDRKIVQRKN